MWLHAEGEEAVKRKKYTDADVNACQTTRRKRYIQARYKQ
jgi:hypothetical protein